MNFEKFVRLTEEFDSIDYAEIHDDLKAMKDRKKKNKQVDPDEMEEGVLSGASRRYRKHMTDYKKNVAAATFQRIKGTNNKKSSDKSRENLKKAYHAKISMPVSKERKSDRQNRGRGLARQLDKATRKGTLLANEGTLSGASKAYLKNARAYGDAHKKLAYQAKKGVPAAAFGKDKVQNKLMRATKAMHNVRSSITPRS